MYTIPEQFIAAHRQSLETMQALALASLTGVEKLAELNLQAAKASLKEGVEQGVALLEKRDVQALTETLAESAQPTTDKFSAYAKHVYEIASETSAEIAKIAELQMSEGNRQLFSAIDTMAKNAPQGTEGLVTMVKSAVTAANSAWDQVNKAGKQAVEMAEANVATVTRAPVKRKVAA